MALIRKHRVHAIFYSDGIADTLFNTVSIGDLISLNSSAVEKLFTMCVFRVEK